MVQVRENLTEVEGTVLERSRHPSIKDYDTVMLRVEHVRPVAGVANLLESVEPGAELPIVVRRELLGSASAGARLRGRVFRAATGEVLAEPHPAPEHFSVAS
jgi:hypothetical protein